MDYPNFSRSQALNNIPAKKVQDYLDAINNSGEEDKIKHVRLIAANRYAESNIPVEYWSLKMDKDFHGDPRLLEKYNRYAADIKSAYMNGASFCLAGNHGVGKTLTTCCVLKKASQMGYSCLYTTLSDVVNVLTQSNDKYNAKKELTMVDFLCLDEVDNRFFNQSEFSNELFSKNFESIIRSRLQNKLPILTATNSPNIKESFVPLFKESLGSLLNKISITIVMGNDFRKQ